MKRFFWSALTFKLITGIALGLVYQYYYISGDTFSLFQQAKAQADHFFYHPGDYLNFLLTTDGEEWQGELRASFFVKIISLFSLLSWGNYWITSLWFSFISFLSTWYFFKLINRFFPKSLYSAAFAFLFFPSVVFWSSGIIKESFALAGLYMLAGLWLKGMMNQRPALWEWLVGILAMYIVWNLKYYWLAIFLPLAFISLIIQYTTESTVSKWKYTAWTGLIILFFFIIQFIHPNFYPGYFLQVLVANHNAFIPISDPSNLIHYYHLSPTWGSIVLNSPWALISGLFRPFVWEAHGWLSVLASIENLLVLILFCSSMQLGKIYHSPYRLIIITTLAYCFVLCVFLSISTPNLGSLARYKVAFIPFLTFLLSCDNLLVNKVKRMVKGH